MTAVANRKGEAGLGADFRRAEVLRAAVGNGGIGRLFDDDLRRANGERARAGDLRNVGCGWAINPRSLIDAIDDQFVDRVGAGIVQVKSATAGNGDRRNIIGRVGIV